MSSSFLRTSVAAVALFAAACGSDSGTDGVMSVSGVWPSSAFVGKNLTVLVTGSGTNWSEAAQVNFGDGITVSETVVATPSAILATLDIASDAVPGTRDITVSDSMDGEAMTYDLPGVFRLESALVADVQGLTAQGSISIVSIQNLDFESPFDTTQMGDGFFEPISFPNLNIDLGEGLTAQVNAVEPYKVEFLLLTDVLAEAGPRNVQVLSGPEGSQRTLIMPGGLDVQARTAEALTSGTPVMASAEGAYDSALYSFDPGNLAFVDILISSSTEDTQPAYALLPTSGAFADMITYTNMTSIIAGAPYYLIYWDGTGSFGYEYTLRAIAEAAASADEVEDNNTYSEAQVAGSLPFVVEGASLIDVDDEDWIAITVGEADIGKSIRVMTVGGDPMTDTVVEVFESDGTSSLGGPSSDLGYHENFLSDAIPEAGAGTYYVKVSASIDWFDPAHKTYSVGIRLE